MQSPCYRAAIPALPQGLIGSVLCLWRCSSEPFLVEGQPFLLPGYCLAEALRRIPGASLEEDVSGIFRFSCTMSIITRGSPEAKWLLVPISHTSHPCSDKTNKGNCLSALNQGDVISRRRPWPGAHQHPLAQPPEYQPGWAARTHQLQRGK